MRARGWPDRVRGVSPKDAIEVGHVHGRCHTLGDEVTWKGMGFFSASPDSCGSLVRAGG